MAFLLDTNVVAEGRKRNPDPHVMRWFASVSGSDLYLSVLVVGEVTQGIERLHRRDPAQAAGLRRWLATLREAYADRIVPVDLAVAEAWGRMNAPDPLPPVDGLLAATAHVRGWTLVTRNTKDVERTGVALLDPFEPLPSAE